MPFAVNAVAPTREDAERQVIGEAPALRVVRCRRIDFTGLPPMLSGPRPEHWVVLVEHTDPAEDARRSLHDDPETACEREVRQLYLKMALDPQLLVTSVMERFACPACEAEVSFELPPPRETRYPIQHCFSATGVGRGSCAGRRRSDRMTASFAVRGPTARST
jgi:hypothetical protein